MSETGFFILGMVAGGVVVFMIMLVLALCKTGSEGDQSHERL